MTPPSSGADLRSRLLAIIGRGAGAKLAEDEFDRLAMDVFRHQYERNAIYRRFCDARGANPDSVEESQRIPAVPSDAFKVAALLCGDPRDAEVAFRTSGTTRGRESRGVHYLLDTGLYRAALVAGFERHLLPASERMRMISLVAPFAEAPDSSLSFMISEVVSRFGAEGSRFYASADTLMAEPLVAALSESQAEGAPVLLMGTSLAFVHLLDRLQAENVRLDLAAGSRVMDTGGFKGVGREVGREDLYTGITNHLGIPPAQIVNEYGMTELSSQLYDGVAGSAAAVTERRYEGPGWMRSFAADPETLDPLPEGEMGILRHFDLANLDSVMAVQTADLGIVAEGEIQLRGRARGAEARGCSIAMDELVAAAARRPG